MILERAQGLSNAEGVRAERIAATLKQSNPALAALVLEVAQARLDIPTASNAADVFKALEGVQAKRENARMASSLLSEVDALKAKEQITEAELQEGLRNIMHAATRQAKPAHQLNEDALALKARAGKHLLETRHAEARATVDALVGDDAERITTLGEQERQALDDVKAHYGGNNYAANAFFDALERDGVPRRGQTQQTLNLMYRDWLREQALEKVPSYREAVEASERLGKAVIAAAKEATGITPHHAANIAARSLGSGRGLRGVASRAGWKPKDMDADMVELAQVAGRMIPRTAKIEIGSKADIEKAVGFAFNTGMRGRSFHSEMNSGGIGRVSKTYVVLSGNISKRTLYHEVGHAVEAVNPAVNGMIAQWLKQRIGSEKPTRLRALTGIRAYKGNEVAVKDGFIDPYVGKIYEPRQGMQTNEVLAMGLERLATPAAAAQLAAKDPDHLAVIMAALNVEYQP